MAGKPCRRRRCVRRLGALRVLLNHMRRTATARGRNQRTAKLLVELWGRDGR